MADLRTRIIISSDDQTRQGFDSARQGLANLQRQVDQIRNALIGVLGVSLGAGLVKQLVDTADEFKNLQSAIKLSTTSEQEFNQANTELFNIAQRTGTGLRENVDLFRRVSASIRDMGSDQERALNLIELIDKSVALSGVSAETSAAGIQQFNQGLGSGVLRGEEFNSVMENTPRLAQALADGLQSTKGELRSMAEQGKLTTETVVKALESQADVLNREFTKVPDTVGRALVRVGNAWTVFLGKLDEGKGASASIAGALNTVAENMEQLVNAGYALVKVLALVWAGKFVTGITQNTAAVINNAIATREANAAALQLLQTEVRRAEVAVRTSLNLIQEARMQRALATTEQQRVAAQRALDAAYTKHEANVAALAAQQALLNQATRQGTLSMLLFGNAVGLVSRAFALLNRVFIAFLLIDIARTVYDWLNSFDEFRKTMIIVSATVEHLMIVLSYLLSGKILAYWDEMNRKLDENSKKWGDQYFAVGKSVDGTTQKVQEAAEEHKIAWQKVEESIKNLTTLSDEQFARQNADLQRHLAERLAAIDASDAQEQEKDAQRAEALAQSAQAEIDLAKQTADEKLALLTLTYDRQLEKLGQNSARAEALERASIEKRKEIYSQLAQHYAAVVDRLAQEHDREVQAARAAAEALKQLALQHEFELNDIQRAGATEYQKIQSEKFEFEQTLSAAKAEIDKGKAGDQDKINSLLERAHELTRDITSSEISLAETDSEVYAARSSGAQRLNDLYAEQKTALENVQRAHEDNADILARKQEEALAKLEAVNTEINKIALKLERDYQLQINVDTQAVDAAIAKINSIPTEKTVTIRTRTVDEGAVAARQSGGSIFPIQLFANGGWPRANGQIPGFGGGDKVRLLAEKGEFVVRKEGVKQLQADYGAGAMWMINRGMLPIRRAEGGSVWDHYLGGLGKSKSYNTVATISRFFFGRKDIEAAQRRLFELSEKALKGQIERITIDPNSPLYAAAFQSSASPGDIRRLNISLQKLFDSQIDRLKSVKVSVPAPVFPSPANSIAPPVARSSASDTVTLRFQSPSGRTASVQSNKSDVANVLQVLKEAGAVTV
jgi:tape measure domain-containing protein